MKLPQITDAEYSIMKVLWNKKKCTSSEIVEEVVKEHKWNDKTIRTLINRLVAKKAVLAENNGSKAFSYSPLISKTSYENAESRNFINKFYGGSVKMMLASFVKNNGLSEKDIDELKKILEGDC